MKALLLRFARLLKVWLGALLASADDPRQTFASAYQRQRDLLVDVQRAVANIDTAKTLLEQKMTEVRQKLPRLEEQARRALADRREDLARLLVRHSQLAEMELRTLEDHVQDVRQEEQRLFLVEQRLSAHVEAFFARQEIVAARYSAAEAQVRVNEALSGVSQELVDFGLVLERAERKAESMQARAMALDRLMDSAVLQTALPGYDWIERRLAGLDVDQAVDRTLTALKREVGEGAAASPERSQERISEVNDDDQG